MMPEVVGTSGNEHTVYELSFEVVKSWISIISVEDKYLEFHPPETMIWLPNNTQPGA